MDYSSVIGGFGRGDLCDALPEKRLIHGTVQVNAAYFCSGRRSAVYCVLDFMDFDSPSIEMLKAAACAASGTPPENVHILTTHNHSADALPNLDMRRIAPVLEKAVRDAVADAVPLVMNFAAVNVEEQLNYRRRIVFDEISPDFDTTIFYGPSPENGYDAGTSLEMQLSAFMKDGTCTYSGIPGNVPEDRERSLPPGDNRLAVWKFTDMSGKVRGWFCRYAAHAICCNCQGYYSGDYPAFLRAALEENGGGIAIFFNGPCGDVAPGLPDKVSGYELKLGKRLAEIAVSALESSVPEQLTEMQDHMETIPVAIRGDFPIENEKHPRDGSDMDIVERRRAGERRNLIDTRDFLMDKMRNADGSPEVYARIGLLRLNNVLLLSLPGETFWTTGEKILEKAALDKGLELVTATEHDRTLMYIVPPEECGRGGYENCCRMVDESFEPGMVRAAVALVEKERAL